MYMLGWAATWDADGILYPLLRSGQRFARWNNPDFDRLIETGAHAPSTRASAANSTARPAGSPTTRRRGSSCSTAWTSTGSAGAVADWEPTSDESTSTVMLRAAKKK